MHAEGERFRNLAPQDVFPGKSLPPQAPRIKRLVERTGAASILDYGSGKGRQYEMAPFTAPDGTRYDCIQDYWDVDYVQCYDPSYPPYSALPQGRFDGVVSTDVLEHCPEEDIPWIVDEIFGYAERFVFANVACYPAMSRMPNGANAHCTIRPSEWWIDLLKTAAAGHPDLVWEFVVGWRNERDGGPRYFETIIRSESAA
jgi:hypothetical protein